MIATFKGGPLDGKQQEVCGFRQTIICRTALPMTEGEPWLRYKETRYTLERSDGEVAVYVAESVIHGSKER